MTAMQDEHLERTCARLGVVLLKAERRCARYKTRSTEREIDIAFVEHLAVALHEIHRYQREKYLNACTSEDNPTAYLKDAILQLHELSSYTNKRINELDNGFMKKFFISEDRWLRMITISLVGLLINICTDQIRVSLSAVQRSIEKLGKMNGTSAAVRGPSERPYLRVVK
jgi:hypothetical protein